MIGGIFGGQGSGGGVGGMLGNINQGVNQFSQNNSQALMQLAAQLFAGNGLSGAAAGWAQGSSGDEKRRLANKEMELRERADKRDQGLYDLKMDSWKLEQSNAAKAAERSIASRTQLAQNAGLPLESVLAMPQSAVDKLWEQQFEVQKAQSTIGKIQQDVANGIITPEAGEAAVRSTLSKGNLSIQSDGAGGFSVVMGADGTNLGKAANNEIDKNIVGKTQTLGLLDRVQELFDPNEFGWGARGRGLIDRGFDQAGLSSAEQQERLGARTKLVQTIDQLFNAYRKEITGAAASVQELERLKASFLNSDLSPTEAQAAMENLEAIILRDIQIADELKNQGFKQGTPAWERAFNEASTGVGADQNAGGQVPANQTIRTYNPATGELE